MENLDYHNEQVQKSVNKIKPGPCLAHAHVCMENLDYHNEQVQKSVNKIKPGPCLAHAHVCMENLDYHNEQVCIKKIVATYVYLFGDTSLGRPE
jgi:hypothetical protein